MCREGRKKRSFDTNTNCLVLYPKPLVFAFFSRGLSLFPRCDNKCLASKLRKICFSIRGPSRCFSPGLQAGFVPSRAAWFLANRATSEQVKDWEKCSCRTRGSPASHQQQQAKRDTEGSAFTEKRFLPRGPSVMNYQALWKTGHGCESMSCDTDILLPKSMFCSVLQEPRRWEHVQRRGKQRNSLGLQSMWMWVKGCVGRLHFSLSRFKRGDG